MGEITETKILKGIRVLPGYSAIEVEWLNRVERSDGTVIAETPLNGSYSKYERTRFLSDMTDNPSAATYADLAGMVDPDPISTT